MTHTMTEEDDDDVDRSLVAAILDRGAGYGIELFGLLYARGLENGSFAVGVEGEDDEIVVGSAREAAELFIRRRRETKLGFDYERAPDT